MGWGGMWPGVRLQERLRRPLFLKKVEVDQSKVIANTSEVINDKLSVCVEQNKNFKNQHDQHGSSEMRGLPECIV